MWIRNSRRLRWGWYGGGNHHEFGIGLRLSVAGRAVKKWGLVGSRQHNYLGAKGKMLGGIRPFEGIKSIWMFFVSKGAFNTSTIKIVQRNVKGHIESTNKKDKQN